MLKPGGGLCCCCWGDGRPPTPLGCGIPGGPPPHIGAPDGGGGGFP